MHNRPAREEPEPDRWPAIILAFACLWMIFLAYPAAALVHGAKLTVPGALAFVGFFLYFVVFFRAIRQVMRRGDADSPLWELVVMGVLATAVPLAGGSSFAGLFIYAALVAGLILPLVRLLAATAAIIGLTLAVARLTSVAAWETTALILLTVFGSVIAWGLAWLRRADARLRAARKEVARLAAREERLYLARELHDSVKQSVFVSSMEIGAARSLIATRPEEAERHLDEAASAIRLVHEDLNALINELRPLAGPADGPPRGSFAEGSGLSPAGRPDRSRTEQPGGDAPRPLTSIHELVDRWTRRTGVRVVLDLAAEHYISGDAGSTVANILKEALINIERHSGADQVRIALRRLGSSLTMEVCDNGGGFLADGPVAYGHGLTNMRERAASLGGRLSVQSTPGESTCIACTWPVVTPANADNDA